MAGDHYVVIQDWRPYFQLEDDPISTLGVWVRLTGIPLEYFDGAILTIIGNRIGKTVRLLLWKVHEESCLMKPVEDMVEVPEVLVANPIFQSKSFNEISPDVEENFDPWMKVLRSNRKGKKCGVVASPPKASLPVIVKPILGNKFEALSKEDNLGDDYGMGNHEEGVSDEVEVKDLVEINKENLDGNYLPKSATALTTTQGVADSSVLGAGVGSKA
ncbi:hypothetical protein LINPERHAP2_LOCUS42402 [Linum perenne]